MLSGSNQSAPFVEEEGEGVIGFKLNKMVATYQGTKEAVRLYEGEIANNRSGAKLFLDQTGLWKISVTVDDQPFVN